MTLKHIEKEVDSALKMGEPGGVIDPVRLEKDSTFNFRCHPGISCFNRCCHNVNIILTPYDIVRIKNMLGLTADMFLQLYTTPEILSRTELPVARLKMLEEEGGRCPFVSPKGCQIYSDRPVCCRYYPLGIASLRQQDKVTEEEEEFFFVVREDHCKGFEEPTEWTVDSWRADQESDIYDSMNRGWLELLLRKASFGEEAKMPEKAKQLFFMVTTNMERFRKYVFESPFLGSFAVDNNTLEKILKDDVALMQFGFEYLKHVIFGAESDIIRLKKDVLDKTVKKIIKKRRKKKKGPNVS